MQALYLSPRAGWQWSRKGFQLFMKQPLAFFTWTMSLSVLVILAMLIPLIGMILFLTLTPIVVFLSLSACQKVETGQKISLLSWFEPLKQASLLKKLLLIGMLYVFLSCLIGLVAFLPFIHDVSKNLQIAVSSRDLIPFYLAIRAPLALFCALYVVVAAFFWYAPALVAWHNIRIVQALFFSAIACWRNKWVFLVYGMVWIGIFVIIEIAANLLVWLGLSIQTVNTLQIPFNIAAGAMLYCSFYPAYTSVFSRSN